MNNSSWNGTDFQCMQPTTDKKETYIIPIMISIGATGNILTIILFKRGKQKRLSVSIYICAYCIGNLSNLVFHYGVYLITLVSGLPELSNLSSWGCSLSRFVTNVIQFCSVWFVVGMTIDRYIAACHPANARSMCTVFMAKVAVGITLIGLVVVSVHALWIFGIDGCGNCGYSGYSGEEPNLYLLHYKIWIYQSAIAYAYLPMAILLVLNVLLIFGLCFQHSSSSTSTQDNVSTEYTNTVVAISVTHFSFLLPATIINILSVSHIRVSTSTQNNSDYVQRVKLVDVFFLCLIFSRSFRQEIRNIYQQLKDRRKHSLEMNRLSNKSLITNDATPTTTNEDDTLI